MTTAMHLNVEPRRERPIPAPSSSGIEGTLKAAWRHLLAKQHPESGYWRADLLSNTNIEANAIVVYHVLGRGNAPQVARMAKHILAEQLADGGWPEYRYGPSALTATVRAYWALKLAGHSAEARPLVRARAVIESLGGIHAINSYAKFNLALFGLYDWRGVAAIPPELVLLPSWSPLNIYRMAGWSRAVIVPMSIAWAKRPCFACPPSARIDELFPDERRWVPPVGSRISVALRRLASVVANRMPTMIRKRAVAEAERWVNEHCKSSDGLGAILVGMMSAIIAMKSLGYDDADPRLLHEVRNFQALEVDRGDTVRSQLCLSPVWDTAIVTIGLCESGLATDHPAITTAIKWLVSKEIRRGGDWQVANPDAVPSGWAFEFENPFYPDVDDTAMVLLALDRVALEGNEERARVAALARGTEWLLSMQCRNGGWGAYDKNNTSALLDRLPFADHKAMIDPPTADITGRVLELVGRRGYSRQQDFVQRALDFLASEQEIDGSWRGRWGVNYLYGTWQVLRGMASVKADMHATPAQRALAWLKSVQHEDGGWGETCASYYDANQKGRGPSTPSQTSWALMGLMTVLPHDDLSVRRGIDYLVRTQQANGGWLEDVETGTAIPGLLYFSYNIYRDAFPLWALGRFRALGGGHEEPACA